MSMLLKKEAPTSSLEDLTAFSSSSGLMGPGRPAQSLLLRDRRAAASLPEPVSASGGNTGRRGIPLQVHQTKDEALRRSKAASPWYCIYTTLNTKVNRKKV